MKSGSVQQHPNEINHMQLKKKKQTQNTTTKHLLGPHFEIQNKSSLSKSIHTMFQYCKQDPANMPWEDGAIQMTGLEIQGTPTYSHAPSWWRQTWPISDWILWHLPGPPGMHVARDAFNIQRKMHGHTTIWGSWGKTTGSEDLSRSTVQNSPSLYRFEKAQNPPRRKKSCRRTPFLLPPSATGQRHLTGPTCLPFSSRPPAAVAAAPRCCRAGRARGEPSRPWARPGLPPLPALLSPTRPRAHQAAAGGGGGARPGSPAGGTGGARRAERGDPAGSRVLPARIVTGKTWRGRGAADLAGLPRGSRESAGRSPPPPPVRRHARLAPRPERRGSGSARLRGALRALGMQTGPRLRGLLVFCEREEERTNAFA